ncbi:hypothetical protein GEM_3463 [Burkholderia cepacia GG4]|uniref:Uncharacterized protein n=1 Tax=Burkholderia cepacia GG4 TaxID=1009846 RepID=A0A9W3K2Y9_BURCE|nr:hypothetical protein GEM_3463 [Burkholderia cepacia GG4]
MEGGNGGEPLGFRTMSGAGSLPARIAVSGHLAAPGMSRRVNSPSRHGVTLSNCRNNFVTSFAPNSKPPRLRCGDEPPVRCTGQ